MTSSRSPRTLFSVSSVGPVALAHSGRFSSYGDYLSSSTVSEEGAAAARLMV